MNACLPWAVVGVDDASRAVNLVHGEVVEDNLVGGREPPGVEREREGEEDERVLHAQGEVQEAGPWAPEGPAPPDPHVGDEPVDACRDQKQSDQNVCQRKEKRSTIICHEN